MGDFYLLRVIRFGASTWLKRSKDGAGRLIKYIVQAALLMLLLIYSPLLEKINEDEELQLISAGMISLVGSGVLFLIWDILLAPSRMQKISDFQNVKFKQFIGQLNNNESAKKRLSEFHCYGIKIYDRDFEWSDFENWKLEFEHWISCVEIELEVHWTIRSIHHFRDAGLSGNFSRMRTRSKPTLREIEAKEDIFLLGRYTSCLQAVDDIIRTDDPIYIVKRETLTEISKF